MKSTFARLSAASAGATLALALLFALALPVAAHAATFASEVPVGSIHSTPTVVAVDAITSVSLDKRYCQIKVDGVAFPTYLTNIGSVTGHWVATETWDAAKGVWTTKWNWVPSGPDATRATVYCYPVFPATLADGPHTVLATVRTTTGVTSTYTWTFTLGVAPVLGTPTPAPGARVATLTPAISVPVADNGLAGASATATVNGAPAAASIVGGVARVTSPLLANDATATVALSVTDAAGNRTTKSWAFFVETYADMFSTLGNCTGCHHDDATHTGMVPGLGWSTCQRCHSVQPHPAVPAAMHTRANVTGCSPCHVSDLTVEHTRHLDHAANAMTCATCHSSTDTRVTTAITAGNSACSACHTASSGHEALHVTPVTPACEGAGCHTGTSLTSIHINAETTLTCDTCHESADPDVIGAISGHDKSCTACHDSATTHGDLTAKHANSASSDWVQVHGKMYDWAAEGGVDANCSECHDTGLFAVHANDCNACHSPSASAAVKAAIANHDAHCTTCHPSQHVYQSSHTWIDYSDGCSNCHGSTYSCASCHNAETPVWAPVTTSDAEPTYTGNAIIELTATDGGTGSLGIKATYFRIDGAPAVIGTQLVVPEPVSGTQTHTLSFWSEDWSGHTEGQHTVMFDVTHDAIPPVTSSDVVSGKDYASDQTFTLTATDDSSVTGTWWQLDGTSGSWTSGTSVPVTAPTMSTVQHTLYFYSRDTNGNTEAPKSVSFTMTPGQDFPFTGADQSYVVPSGVTTIGVVMTGGSGGSSGSASGGRGGRVQSVMSVTPGSTLTLKVGGTTAGGSGGWPNGGSGSIALGTGGGGSSSLWFGSTELAEAGGGGGAGYLGAGGNGGAQGTLPGGFKTGASAPLYSAGGGGGGWNAGAAGSGSPVYTGGTGGTSYVVSGTGTTYAPGSNTGNGLISIRFTAPGSGPFTLAYAAGTGGTISGTSPQTVARGANGTAVTAVANTGYHFVNWSDASTANPRTDTNVTADMSVTANFAINTYTLTYAAGTGGTITGTSPQTVSHGGNGTSVTAVANNGYHFVNWSDGVATAARTETNVTANKSVTANFAVNTYTLTYTAGSGGTITGTSPQTVNHGANGTAVTAVANNGYHFVNWSDGVATAARTETNVTANKSVTANFAADVVTYTLTYSAGTNGTISGTSPQVVPAGGSGTAVTAVADGGYHFVKWSDDSVVNPRTDANVVADLSLTATFEADAPAGGNPVTFTALGVDQTFMVPAGVTALNIDLFGSQGGNGGGAGGRVQATISVTPGQILTVRVGDQGGWPNGGAGTPWGGAGGGSTSLLSGTTILAEAGGGGGYANGSPNQAGPGGYAGSDPGGNAWGDDAWEYGAGGGGGWNGGGNGGGDDTSGDGGTSRVPGIPSAILTPGVQGGSGLAIIGW